MRAMVIAVRDVFGQHRHQMAVDDQHWVEQFAADSSDSSSGDPVRPRCPYRGAQDTHALAGEHGIERGGELAVAVPDQKPELGCAVAEVHQKVARLLGHPGTMGVGSDSQDVGATGRLFDHKQHIQPLEQQGVDTEEVRGENAPGLHPQELPPAGPVAARGGIDAGSFETRPHGTGCYLVAELGEFAVDAPVTLSGVLGGQPQDQPP